MTSKKTVSTLIIMVFAALLAVGCGGTGGAKSDSVTAVDTASLDETAEPGIDTCSEAALSAADGMADEGAEAVAAQPQAPKPQRQGSPSPTYGGKETLYISTYGANGKVWGHVTMNGKTGRGTIHDDDENSYSITVTRHGGELFGTDQNGRQYVFQL